MRGGLSMVSEELAALIPGVSSACGDLDSPGRTQKPRHLGLQAWLPGPSRQVSEMRGVGLSWQRWHWAGTWEVQPTLRVAREQLGSGPGPWATTVSPPRLLAA